LRREFPALAPVLHPGKCNADPAPRSYVEVEALVTPIRRMSAICLLLAAAACGTGQDTGSVEVTTLSDGQDVDPDGYTVEIVGTGSRAIGPNATVRFEEVTAGDHEVRLTAVRGNCAVQRAHPRLIRVTADATFQMRFEVACAHAPLLGRMVFTSDRTGNREIYSMTPDGSSQQQLTNSELWEVYPSISPDGARILFEGYQRILSDVRTDSDLYLINADGTGLVALTDDEAHNEEEPAWSPDGTRIAFSSDQRDVFDWDIYVMNADGTDIVNVTRTPDVTEIASAWSPDGARILFLGIENASEDDYYHNDYYIMKADGSERTRVTSDSTFKSHAAWSPNGKRIVFMSAQENQGYDLFVMDVDGANRVRLTSLPGSEHYPSWSPDGSRIAFTYDEFGAPNSDVYLVNPDGTGLRNVSNSADIREVTGLGAWGP
jgi:Tol biopolymer transport system component